MPQRKGNGLFNRQIFGLRSNTTPKKVQHGFTAQPNSSNSFGRRQQIAQVAIRKKQIANAKKKMMLRRKQDAKRKKQYWIFRKREIIAWRRKQKAIADQERKMERMRLNKKIQARRAEMFYARAERKDEMRERKAEKRAEKKKKKSYAKVWKRNREETIKYDKAERKEKKTFKAKFKKALKK